MAATFNKALMRLSTLLLALGNQHHILAYIDVRDVDMKLLRIRAIQCRHKIIISILRPKVQFVGG